MKDIELNDTQIALLIKLSLDFNAGVIARVAPLYGQDIKPEKRRQIGKELKEFSDSYYDATMEVLTNEGSSSPRS